MTARFLLSLALGATLLAGCAMREKPITAERAATTEWQRIATPGDRQRLRGWRPTWLAALAEARRADAAGVAREGALLLPDAALAGAVPPAGPYRCRTLKLGSRGGVGTGFVAYPRFDCFVAVEDGAVELTKSNGSQRPTGVVFPDGPARAIFLGTLVLGDEVNPGQYGRDPARDLAGVVERIGPRRWRLALPEPRFESRLDVIELVPLD